MAVSVLKSGRALAKYFKEQNKKRLERQRENPLGSLDFYTFMLWEMRKKTVRNAMQKAGVKEPKTEIHFDKDGWPVGVSVSWNFCDTERK